MNIFDVVASMKIARDAIREGLEATEPHAQAAFAHTAANRYFDALFAVCTQLEPYHMDNDDNVSDRAQLALVFAEYERAGVLVDRIIMNRGYMEYAHIDTSSQNPCLNIRRLESDINARCHIKSEVEKYLYLDEIYRRA